MDAARTEPLALKGFLPAWDIERRRVDLGPLAGWVQAQLRRLGYPVGDLGELHRHLDPTRALEASRALIAVSFAPEPRTLIERAIREAIPEIAPERIWLQTHAHVRILVPEDTRSPFPPHTDFGFGHALEERNVWLSLTDAQGDGALRVMPLGDSLAWMARANHVHGVLDQAPEFPPTPTRAGDVLLFTPLHLHRARAPAAGSCRVSVDLRLKPRPVAAHNLQFLPLRGDPR